MDLNGPEAVSLLACIAVRFDLGKKMDRQTTQIGALAEVSFNYHILFRVPQLYKVSEKLT